MQRHETKIIFFFGTRNGQGVIVGESALFCKLQGKPDFA